MLKIKMKKPPIFFLTHLQLYHFYPYILFEKKWTIILQFWTIFNRYQAKKVQLVPLFFKKISIYHLLTSYYTSKKRKCSYQQSWSHHRKIKVIYYVIWAFRGRKRNSLTSWKWQIFQKLSSSSSSSTTTTTMTIPPSLDRFLLLFFIIRAVYCSFVQTSLKALLQYIIQ